MSLYIRKKPGPWRPLLIFVIICVALGLLGYGAWGLWRQYHATHDPAPTVTTQVITHSTDQPSETKPIEACQKYKAAAAYPERISIPKISVTGCIAQVGIDQDGAIAVPDNIYNAGWYVESALPGEEGLSIIDGHISGQYKVDAIFQYLDQLKSGDTFTITRGDGTILEYEVYKQQSVPLGDAANVLLAKDRNIVHQLNLITCGGEYNKDTKLYDRRIIISAKQTNA